MDYSNNQENVEMVLKNCHYCTNKFYFIKEKCENKWQLEEKIIIWYKKICKKITFLYFYANYPFNRPTNNKIQTVITIVAISVFE